MKDLLEAVRKFDEDKKDIEKRLAKAVVALGRLYEEIQDNEYAMGYFADWEDAAQDSALNRAEKVLRQEKWISDFHDEYKTIKRKMNAKY